MVVFLFMLVVAKITTFVSYCFKIEKNETKLSLKIKNIMIVLVITLFERIKGLAWILL